MGNYVLIFDGMVIKAETTEGGDLSTWCFTFLKNIKMTQGIKVLNKYIIM